MKLLKIFLAAASLVRHGPLAQDGWVRSYIENKSVDRGGKPIPWITYPALDFLSERISSLESVFEYGSGNGTLWWAARSTMVRSIEHDKSWYEEMKKIVPGNVELFYVSLEQANNYENTITMDDHRYDLILIDGRRRNECMIKSVERVNDTGVILLDNSDRPDYQQGCNFLISKGYKPLKLSGFSPIVNFKNQTAIFYRNQNILGI